MDTKDLIQAFNEWCAKADSPAEFERRNSQKLGELPMYTLCELLREAQRLKEGNNILAESSSKGDDSNGGAL